MTPSCRSKPCLPFRGNRTLTLCREIFGPVLLIVPVTDNVNKALSMCTFSQKTRNYIRTDKGRRVRGERDA